MRKKFFLFIYKNPSSLAENGSRNLKRGSIDMEFYEMLEIKAMYII